MRGLFFVSRLRHLTLLLGHLHLSPVFPLPTYCNIYAYQEFYGHFAFIVLAVLAHLTIVELVQYYIQS